MGSPKYAPTSLLTLCLLLLSWTRKAQAQCSAKTSTIGVNPRNQLFHSQGVARVLFISAPVQCNARVIKWEAYLDRNVNKNDASSCELYGEVWRPDHSASSLPVGYTRIDQTSNFARQKLAQLRPTRPTIVQAGDVIGIYVSSASDSDCLAYRWGFGNSQICRMIGNEPLNQMSIKCTWEDVVPYVEAVPFSIRVTLEQIPPTTLATAPTTTPSTVPTTFSTTVRTVPTTQITRTVTTMSLLTATLRPSQTSISSSLVSSSTTTLSPSSSSMPTGRQITSLSANTTHFNYSIASSQVTTNRLLVTSGANVAMSTTNVASNDTQEAMSHSSSASPVGLIVGMSVLLLAVVVIIILVYIIKRNRHKYDDVTVSPEINGHHTHNHYDNPTMNGTIAGRRGLNNSAVKASNTSNGTLGGCSLAYDDTAFPPGCLDCHERYETIDRSRTSLMGDDTVPGHTPVGAKPLNTRTATLKSVNKSTTLTSGTNSINYQAQSDYLLPGQPVEILSTSSSPHHRSDASPKRSPRISPLPAPSANLFDDMTYASPSAVKDGKPAVKPKPSVATSAISETNVYDLPDSKQNTLKASAHNAAPLSPYHVLETPTTDCGPVLNNHQYHTLEAQPKADSEGHNAYHVTDVQGDKKRFDNYSNTELLKSRNGVAKELRHDSLCVPFSDDETLSRQGEGVYYSNVG